MPSGLDFETQMTSSGMCVRRLGEPICCGLGIYGAETRLLVYEGVLYYSLPHVLHFSLSHDGGEWKGRVAFRCVMLRSERCAPLQPAPTGRQVGLHAVSLLCVMAW